MNKSKGMYRNIIFLIFGFYCFICTIIVPIGTLLLRQDSKNWGDIFSLGQFLADLCLIPFAIVAFIVTLQELRKSQERADLQIGWEGLNNEEKEFLTDKPISANFHSPSIVINNTGNTPSIHYQITLEIPVNIGRTKMMDTHWKSDRQGNSQRFIYTSAAHLVLFPNAPHISLGRIEFTETSLLPDEIIIKYYISSEKSEYKNGNLIISFGKEKTLT